MAITRFINPPTMSKTIGFAHVVDITGPGRMIFIAGQLGIDADGARVFTGSALSRRKAARLD
jgi:enamine deaminase RidA (YjgF/YER057c/UK114 family)